MTAFMQRLLDKLRDQQEQNLYRTREATLKRLNVRWQREQSWFLSFMSNDYLNLSQHPDVLNALWQGAKRYGVGGVGAQLLGGYCAIHQELEQELAKFLGFERTLIFASGFMANLGVLTTFLTSADSVFLDYLCHASLIDGVRYSQAQLKRYPHRDYLALEEGIKKSLAKANWIITDGVFSMEGDLAPLPQICQLAKKYACHLMLDDTHGIGVLGNQGRGILEYYQIPTENVSILVGGFGKAFGTMGAFVAGNTIFIETLVQYARSYIYTTALSPALACATAASLRLIQQEHWRGEYLNFLIKYFYERAQALNLPVSRSLTPIQTLILKSSTNALQAAQLLKEKGVLVGVARPPTVPFNTARLRINLNAQHSVKDIDFLLDNLADIYKNFLPIE